MGKTVNPTDVTGWTQSINGSVWTPQRQIGQLGGRLLQIEYELQRQRRKGPQKIDTTSGAAVKTPSGLPKQVLSCAASQSPLKQIDRTYSQIAVSFTRDPGDKNFAGVHIWVTGYHGNSQPVLAADAADSPAIFLLESTGEAVTITVQPFNGGHVAAPFAGAKTCAAILSGVVTAPPAPSIATQTATITSGATTLGQQFSFNFPPATLADVILGFWVYRVGSHVAPTPPASRLLFIANNPNQQGAYTVSDPSGVSTNFYYVSAVNKTGLESSLTDATPGGGGGTIVTTYRPTAATAVSGGGFSNPSNAWDGNASTYSGGSAGNGISPVEESWQGFSANANAGTTTLVQLKITSQVASVSGTPTATLRYSINGGTSWTNVYSTHALRSQQTDAITLANGQDLTQVKVDYVLTAASSNLIAARNYETWIEVTHT